ncbi:MAG: S8 family serine peptidase [Candidatus Zixiibacteriota bacterium]
MTSFAYDFQHQFYSQGQQISLSIDSTKLLVKFDSTLSQQQLDSVIAGLGAIHSVISLEPPTRGFLPCSLQVMLGEGSWLDSLRSNPSVYLIEPYYRIEDGHPAYFSDRICVAYEENISRQYTDSVNAASGVLIERELFGMPNVFLLVNTPSSNKGIVQLANEYYALPGTRYAYPATGLRGSVFSYKVFDHYSYRQAHLKKIIGSFNEATVWDFAGLTNDVVVAVLDDGVTDHEDLPVARITSGYDFVDNDYNPAPHPIDGHGEACAGIIAAAHTNDSLQGTYPSTGMFSLNPHARIMPVRMIIEGGWLLPPEECAEAVTFSYLSGADVLTCSWGWCAILVGYDALPDAMHRAFNDGRGGKGSIVVFAAGNCGPEIMAWPGYDNSALSVGAVNLQDQLWAYSSIGPYLDLVAPSGDLCLKGDVFTLDQMDTLGYNPSTQEFCGEYVSWGCGLQPRNDEDYDCRFGGTSASAPIVAGVASLLLSRDSMLTSDQVYAIVCSCAVPIGATVPNDTFGYGRVDAFRAVLSIAHGDANNDGTIEIGDLTAVVEYVFLNGPDFFPSHLLGDYNCDGLVDITDVQLLIDYIILGIGDPPVKPCYQF